MEKNCKDKSCLDDFKKEYQKYEKNYKIPKFEEINLEFHIEKIADVETYYFLREIRKFMSEKLVTYLRFVESIINPINSPMFVFSITKNMNQKDKDMLIRNYTELSKIEMNFVERDLDYSEEKEAEFINNSYETWKKIKKELLDFIQKVKKNWDNKTEINGKGYLG